MEEFINKNPDMRYLPKNVLKLRFNNINNYRKKLIEEVKKKRKKIIENNNASNSNIPKIESKLVYELEKDYNETADKDKKDIAKFKQRQKNQIDAEIEVKIKIELLKYQNNIKDSLIKDMSDKIKEERRLKTLMDEKKEKEKELIREKVLKEKIKEQEKKILEKKNI